MTRSQRLLLSPTTAQRKLLAGAAGLSRFAWNWAVGLCQRHYEWYGRLPGYKRLTGYDLQRRWNRVKDRHFPWVRRYSKLIPEESFRKVEQAYRAAFARLKAGGKPGFPRFHRKGVNDGFQVVPSRHDPMRRDGRRFNFPRIGLVKCQTRLRWPDAAQVYGRVRLRAGRWWLTLSYDLPGAAGLPRGRPACGIDLGCAMFATVASEGVIVDEVRPPKPYAKAKRRLKRMQRVVSRRARGSANRKRAIRRLARAHERVANVRGDFLHQFSSRIVRRFGVVVLEDLSVKGLAGGMLAGTIHDLGFGEFRRQVEYKAEAVGTRVVLADRFYPSSKTCSSCGRVKTKLELGERTWTCECGVTHDRDHNAAMNLEKLGRGTPEVTPVESGGACSRRRGAGATRRSRNAALLSQQGD